MSLLATHTLSGEDDQIDEPRTVTIRRVYDRSPRSGDEVRILVDRIWPRGIKRDALHLAGWFSDLAPTNELRQWFGHDVARWPEFRRRYRVELAAQQQRLAEVVEMARQRPLVLLYSAREEEHNQAAVLREAIEEALSAT